MNCWQARRMHQDTDRSSSVAMRSSALTISSSIRSPRARSCVFFFAMLRCSYNLSRVSRTILYTRFNVAQTLICKSLEICDILLHGIHNGGVAINCLTDKSICETVYTESEAP